MLSKFIKTSIGVSAAGVLAIATVAKCTAEVLYNNRNDIADKAVNILSEAFGLFRLAPLVFLRYFS